MTSECDARKTNEFLRRRKLRIQQVREQSKEIAKKIRQRAKAEELRYLQSIDGKLQKEYLEHQNKLINKLEQYYADGVSRIGTGHKNAIAVNLEKVQEKPDLSKKRGRDAAAELKRKKQELLDEKKKQLDRRLQAREVANFISKEKTTNLVKKLISNSTKDPQVKSNTEIDAEAEIVANTKPTNDRKEQSTESDKLGCLLTETSTQSGFDEMPKDSTPSVPQLSLPKDDEEKSLQQRETSSSERPSKRINLFAVSDEMPSSLRGRLPCVPEEPACTKPSLTLVSEYIQNRDLRLRESSTATSSKQIQEELQNVRATLLRTRAARQEVNQKNEKPVNYSNNLENKRSSIKFYNHSSREVRDIPQDPSRFVSRDLPSTEDAYSQALRETTSFESQENERQKKLNEMRSKLAVTRQTVEKEYKDTMNFLSSLPKENSRPMRNAHLGEHRQHTQCQNRQRKMQDEYKQIEKECRRHNHNNSNTSRSKNNSRGDSDDDFALKDLQYSWMPVPESDRNLAIHTIPTTFKPSKSGNSVKFSKVDSYHEYRSRHKHTPPTKEGTKEGTNESKQATKKGIETTVIDYDDSESDDEDTSESSDTTPKEENTLKHKNKKGKKVDIEKIIVYKILQSKVDKKGKGKYHTKLLKNLVKSLSPDERSNIIKTLCMSEGETEKEQVPDRSTNKVAFEQLKEGVYKVVNKESGDNMASFYINKSLQGNNSTTHESSNGQESVDNTADTSTSKSNESQRKCKKKNKERQSPERRSENVCREHSTNVTKTDKGVSVLKPPQENQLSQVPSTESFKSAVTETTGNPAKNGLLKILDDCSAENGKFYVGATGLIKDNDYEVVIQVRKKNASAANQKECERVHNEDSGKGEDTRSTQTKAEINPQKLPNLTERDEPDLFQKQNHKCIQINESEPKEAKHVENTNHLRDDSTCVSGCIQVELSAQLQDSDLKSTHKREPVTCCNYSEAEKHVESIPIQNPTKEKSQVLQLSDEGYTQNINKKNMQDKSVFTSRTYAEENVNPIQNLTTAKSRVKQLNIDGHTQTLNEKILQDKSVLTSPVLYSTSTSNDPKRSANTISTQTTLESIEPERPALHHMSSTSTAYMSPPNFVLPAFFKNECNINISEVFDQNGNLQDKGINLRNLKDYCDIYRHCKRKSCRNAKKLYTISRSSSPKYSEYPSYIKNKDGPEHDSSSALGQYTHKKRSKKTMYVNTNSSRNSEKSYESPSRSKAFLISGNHSHEKNVQAKNKKKHICKKGAQSHAKTGSSKRGLVLKPRSMKTSSTLKTNFSSRDKNNKISLSPIIKSYVNHLLDLNKESIKALAVMNQDCSSVTTPGSSIIEEPRNINFKKSSSQNICLQQIKDTLRQQILEQIHFNSKNYSVKVEKRFKKSTHRYSEPKPRHKIKNINISKHIKPNQKCKSVAVGSSDGLCTDMESETVTRPSPKHRDPEIRMYDDMVSQEKKRPKHISTSTHCDLQDTDNHESSSSQKYKANFNTSSEKLLCPVKINRPLSASTQTSRLIDKDVNFMKLAEHKLQNMEKIANLTEKCTERLSNLAKALDEVRRHKLTNSKLSDSSTESDGKSEKLKLQTHRTYPKIDEHVKHKNNNETSPIQYDNNTQSKQMSSEESFNKHQNKIVDACTDIQQSGKSYESLEIHQKNSGENQEYDASEDRQSLETIEEWVDPFSIPEQINAVKEPSTISACLKSYDIISAGGSQHSEVNVEETDSLECIAFLKDIPKPDELKVNTQINNTQITLTEAGEPYQVMKNKSRPPPALCRMNLKCDQDYIAPHELSTVIEIDSPLSVKLKNQSNSVNTSSHQISPNKKSESIETTLVKDNEVSADDVRDSLKTNKIEDHKNKTILKDFADDSKIKMMDLKQFNEIMLKPFISLQEYAKQCNVESLDDGSTNIEDVPKDSAVTEDASSLPSDGSLPDVIAELLKRNIINEPFKFDTGSNLNSTTLSSESTFSVLALSKIPKLKKKENPALKNKKPIAETSDSMSISSNPDLENAFKKLGMGWASSTLKKTKERLALSSSSNTSSTNYSQYRQKKKDNSVIVSNSSAINDSNKQNTTNRVRNVEQQTSHINAMTVNEFLTNELAKKMTFTNKSHKKDVSGEFMSPYETKLPEELKHASSEVNREERTADSGCSGSNNRARTSTPVQIYKSNAFYSSTSSNMSNGFFSNAEDISSVKVTSNSPKYHSTSEKDDLTIPNCSLRMKKCSSDCTPSD